MVYEELLPKIEEFSRQLMGDDYAHGFPHVQRVLRWAENIVEHEKLQVDWFVLRAAVYLHDIGRRLGEPHAYYSALLARGYLLELGVDKETVERVVNAILCHSFSLAQKLKVEPLGPEARVLHDADKLDALGLVGFSRVFWFGAERRHDLQYMLNHFRNKILRLKDMLYFDYSKKVAEELHEKVKAAVEELCRELGAGAGI
ncbi:MAG: HD domain-containing protein [bacterium]|nr:HD domain-containing protein [bacterium]